MGASFSTFTVEKASSKADVEKQFKAHQEELDYDHGHSYSGELNMCTGLDFHDKIFDDETKAEEYIADTAQKWEAAIAVKVKSGKGTYWLIGGWCSS